MPLIDTFRYLVGAYYGMCEMDEYDLKEYVLKDLENYIIDYVNQNNLQKYNLKAEAEDVEANISLKTKLQDCLLALPKINASTELILLIKLRIKKENENNF